MTEERKHVDLGDVEPLRRVEDLEPSDTEGSTPAVGVSIESEREPGPPDDDPLEALRRG